MKKITLTIEGVVDDEVFNSLKQFDKAKIPCTIEGRMFLIAVVQSQVNFYDHQNEHSLVNGEFKAVILNEAKS